MVCGFQLLKPKHGWENTQEPNVGATSVQFLFSLPGPSCSHGHVHYVSPLLQVWRRAQYSPGLRKYCSQFEKAIDDTSIAFKQSKLSPSYSMGQGYVMVTSLSHTRGHLCPLPRTFSRLIIFYIRGHQDLSYSLCSNHSILPLLCNNIHD